MIETTRIWEASIYGADPTVISALEKKYGSKRSGTIYIVADSQGEAMDIMKQLFTSNGYTPPARLMVTPTHLVRQGLKDVLLMPIREFRCKYNHVIEKILNGEEDRKTDWILCDVLTGLTDECGPGCNPDSPEHRCWQISYRVDLPTRTSFRLMPGGSGGFHSPSSVPE